jgi:excisionase family DNA binding protein
MSLSPATESRIRAAFARLADELVEVLAESGAPATEQPDRLLTVPEAMAALGGIARSTFYDLLAEDAIRTILVGKRRLVPQSAVAEFIGNRHARKAGSR